MISEGGTSGCKPRWPTHADTLQPGNDMPRQQNDNYARQHNVDIDDHAMNRMIEPDQGRHRKQPEENSGSAKWWLLEDRKTR